MKLRNRIVAMTLTAVMTAAQTMPVMASENSAELIDEAVIEEVAEESAETEEADYEEIVEEGDVVVVEESEVVTAETTAVADEAPDFSDIFAENVIVEAVDYDKEGNYVVTFSLDNAIDESAEANAYSTNSYFLTSNTRDLKIVGGSFEYDGKSYILDTTVNYMVATNFKARTVKAADLHAAVKSSGLFELAKSLTTAGYFDEGVIKFKYSFKKSKNASDEAYFTLKASVNKKVAKQLGIKGKPLKALKKACKAFSKAAKAETAKAFFSIKPLDWNFMYQYKDYDIGGTVMVNRFTRAIISIQSFSLKSKLDESGKYKKIPGKEYKKKFNTGANFSVTITPKNKNMVGNETKIQLTVGP